jgi:hypothetical protein
MAMRKKDYEAIAAILSQYLCQDGSGEDAVERTALNITMELSDYFLDTQLNYDPDKFLLAVGAASVRRIRR